MTRLALISVVMLLAAQTSPAHADLSCISAPYQGAASPEIASLAARLTNAVSTHPSLAAVLSEHGPTLCLSDELVEVQAYYDPMSDKVVLRSDLASDFQLAILLHELRHLEQYHSGLFPGLQLSMTAFRDARLAMEADAAAVSLHIAWQLRLAGDDGPWQSLAAWPTHDDLADRYAREMTETGDGIQAAAATFAQWYDDAERRSIYAHASYAAYLDAMGRGNSVTGIEELDADFVERLCRLPDGRSYPCTLPGP